MISTKEAENPLVMYRVSVQFLEIYGDDINDLLSNDYNNVKIIIRETSQGEVIVSGAKEEIVSIGYYQSDLLIHNTQN